MVYGTTYTDTDTEILVACRHQLAKRIFISYGPGSAVLLASDTAEIKRRDIPTSYLLIFILLFRATLSSLLRFLIYLLVEYCFSAMSGGEQRVAAVGGYVPQQEVARLFSRRVFSA